MTHHLTDEEAVTHWREAWRVTRDAIFICDLHRNAGLYTLVWLTLHLMRVNPTVVEDGLISVRRGFRLKEWRADYQFGRESPRPACGGIIARASCYKRGKNCPEPVTSRRQVSDHCTWSGCKSALMMEPSFHLKE